MKKCMIMLSVILVCMITNGCYDMADIEDICAVSAIFVDNDSITYCTLNASPDNKEYIHKLYTTDVANLYYGINSLSEKTGKEISLSHLEAIMFSKDCSIERVRENINALLGRTNSHPKSLVAYYEGEDDDFAESVINSEGTGAKYLRQLLDNKFSAVVVCQAMDFCYGVNFEGGGSLAPMISSENGNIVYSGLVYANSHGSALIPRPYSDIVNAIKNKGNSVSYGQESSTEIKCTSYEVIYDKGHHRADIDARFECAGNIGAKGREIREGMEYIVSLKNQGYDVIDIYTDIRKAFWTIPSFEKFVAWRGGVTECVKTVEVSIKTSVGGDVS